MAPKVLHRIWTHRLARQVQVAIDLVVLAAAFVLAYLLRFDFAIPALEQDDLLVQLPLVVLIQLAAVLVTGIYSFIWRYIGLAELQAFGRAAFFSALPVLLLRLGLGTEFQAWRVPLSVILMDTILAFGGLLGVRVLRRMVHERYQRRGRASDQEHALRVLIVGTGDAAVAITRELRSRSDTGLELVGLLDEDRSRVGLTIQGAKVLGSVEELEAVVEAQAIDRVILAKPEVEREQMREIVATCEAIPVEMRIIPALHEILDGTVSVSRLREVRIEDLLGRAEVALDEAALRSFLAGKRVMVTGAGGSIGAEIARQAGRFGPEELILVERAEFALFEVDRRLEREMPEIQREVIVADVGDQARMRTVLSLNRPEIIFHAAAHKHVPLMEHNGSEAVKNNIRATRILAELAGELDVESFVLISTDKAVRPSSIMGATKRVAELLIQDLDRRLQTRFLAVRFGNVLGSAGSVIPTFREQIASGGPVTVTDSRMTRYFMTPQEAAQLVLQSASIGQGGEILLLDMGVPVRILDLARDLITLSGLKPYEDIDIEIVGIREGEKLFEDLEMRGEDLRRTRHPKIFIGNLSPPGPDFATSVRELEELASLGLDAEIREALRRLLPESDLESYSQTLRVQLDTRIDRARRRRHVDPAHR